MWTWLRKIRCVHWMSYFSQNFRPEKHADCQREVAKDKPIKRTEYKCKWSITWNGSIGWHHCHPIWREIWAIAARLSWQYNSIFFIKAHVNNKSSWPMVSFHCPHKKAFVHDYRAKVSRNLDWNSESFGVHAVCVSCWQDVPDWQSAMVPEHGHNQRDPWFIARLAQLATASQGCLFPKARNERDSYSTMNTNERQNLWSFMSLSVCVIAITSQNPPSDPARVISVNWICACLFPASSKVR